MTNSRLARIAAWIAGILFLSISLCVLGFLMLASLSDDAPFVQDPAFLYVASLDGIVYAETIDREVNYGYFQSSDAGLTWTETDAVKIPPGVQGKLGMLLERDERHPITCDPALPEHCYRISPVSDAPECNKLEESRDKGQSWQIVALPFNLTSRRPFCQGSPYDLAFVKSNSDGSYALVIAMGTAGVVVRSSDGQWTYLEMKRFY